MRQLKLALGAAAIAAACFVGGRALAPQEAMAQQAGAAGGPHAPHALDRPHDVVIHLNYGYVPRENMPMEVRVSGALTWDVDAVGAKSLLRLSNQAGKIWYVPLDKVDWIEATPIGGGASGPK